MTSAARKALPRYSASRRRERGALTASALRRCGAVEVVDQGAHAPVDVVARGTDLVERAVLGIRQVPVDPELLLAGYDRARVAAAHSDHRVGLRGQLRGQPLWTLGR